MEYMYVILSIPLSRCLVFFSVTLIRSVKMVTYTFSKQLIVIHTK